MNLPKRTAKVSAADIGALMAAESEEAAQPLVKKLLDAYESAKPVRKEMLAAALAQTGEATRSEDGRVNRPRREDSSAENPDFFAVAVIGPEFADYAGYTGPVAQNVSKRSGKPAVIFAPKGTDEHGQEIYKFSSRNDCGAALLLGGLIEDEEMRRACTLKKRDESGAVVEEPVVGGHAEVVSGSCTAENLPRVQLAMQRYAKRISDEKRGFWPKPWDGPEATLTARKIAPERLGNLEEEASRLAPFTRQKQALYPATMPNKAHKVSNNSELQISVEGTLKQLRPDPENENWLAGELDLGDGVVREVRYPADAQERPENRPCEWVLRLGKPSPYYLRTFFEPPPQS